MDRIEYTGYETHKTIQSITRLDNSRNGNPNYSFTFTDGAKLRTKSNISDAYNVCMNWTGKTVKIEVEWTKKGQHIIGIEG